jgi:hypothetical protein
MCSVLSVFVIFAITIKNYVVLIMNVDQMKAKLKSGK